MHRALPLVILAISSCSVRRTAIIPPAPGAPDSTPAWVDLHPGMELRIDGAYYRDGSPRRGLADYLGDEIATYEVARNGALKLGSVIPLPAGRQRPRDQPDVAMLVRATGRRNQRLFFQVVVSGSGKTRPAILVSARSKTEIDRLTKQLDTPPSATCPCVTFPEWSTASVAITITVNGAPRRVIFGSTLGSVATRPQHVEILRVADGRTAPVAVDLADPQALRTPLINGDRITWN